MSFQIGLGSLLTLLFGVIGLLAATALLIARPWRPGRTPALGLGDRSRISAAVVRYDFWLEWQSVGRARRRDLREELRANLEDATTEVGARRAIGALGSLRRMAAGAGSVTGPRWSTGVSAAGSAAVAVLLLELFALISWLEAADASGVTTVASGLPLFPGSRASWDGSGGGYAVNIEPGWLVFAAALLAFVLGARPWLLLARVRPAVQT